MIKIAPRVIIHPSFMEAVRAMHLSYISAIDKASAGDEGRRKYFLGKNVEATTRAIDCLRGTQGPRRGTNYDIVTRFQADPRYTELWAEEHNDALWFMGKTKSIFLAGHNADLDIGPFIVAYSVDKMAEGGNEHHFYPAGNPMEFDRHPHHYTYVNLDETSPFNLHAETCFGGFDTVIASMIAARDIAGLFQTTHKYLSIYNGGSPLRSIRNIAWIQNLKNS